MPNLDLSGLPGISDIPDEIRILIVLGLGGLLILHRLDAERFNAAEYDDVDRWGNSPSLLRRLAWYTLGVAGILAILIVHPAPRTDLFLSLGDRLGAVIMGLTYGAIGTTIALVIAYIRYHHLRLPRILDYPGAVLNAIATAFIDEAVFRGVVFGLLLLTGIDANLANVTQALLYGLASRLGAPGRPWYMLVAVLAIGLASGWVTGVTGGIGAAFLGHAISRVAIFLATGHAGLPKARGTEVEEIEKRHRTPEGWRVLGPHGATRDH